MADVGQPGSGASRSLIARSHFTRVADLHEVDAKTVERDYVLTHVLVAITQQPGSRGMAFKGGTALRLCYFEDYRYSADLDFSLLDGMSLDEATLLVRNAVGLVREAIGFPHLVATDDGRRIEYVGPLGAKPRQLKLDLATDERVESTTVRPLVLRYDDQPEADVLVYTLEEIAAEKLRCVMQRLLARDLFDLDELFVRRALDLESIWPVFQRKARHKGIDPDRFGESFEKRLPAWSARWEREIEEHVGGEAPAFNRVERGVKRALRARLRLP